MSFTSDITSINGISANQQQMASKLHKIGRIGGGTYGRVYEAKKSSANTESMPGTLSLVTTNNTFFPIINPITFSINNQHGILGNAMPNQPTTPSETFAVKRNFISPILKESIGSIRELDLLNLVKDHPFCIHLKNVSFEIPFVEGILSPIGQNYITDKVFFVLEKGTIDGERYIHSDAYKPASRISNRTSLQPVANRTPLVNERKLFAVQIFLAIEFLHSRGIYHRDIKPANIICMMNQSGELKSAKLTDFGLAQYYSEQTMSTSGFVTLWYRAPEISLMKNYDFKVDIWSLGCILFELFSSGNSRFIQSNSDESLINSIIDRIPFSYNDYILAQQLYPRRISHSYDFSQSHLRTLREQLACTDSQIAQFNSSQLGGKPNSGTFDELIDLMSHMLVVDPNERWTVSSCLNHPFFKGFRELIDKTRAHFGINIDGEWVLKTDDALKYLNNAVRLTAMKWFSIIYSNRLSTPISNWYSHRIFFHAIEMFDRFNLLQQPPDGTPESNIVIWINTFLFISAKYFRVLVPEIGIDMFATGIIPEEYPIFRSRAIQFEEKVIRDIFKCEIYRNTIFEIASDFLTETSIFCLIKSILRAEIPPDTSLRTIWSVYSDILSQINRTPSPTNSPNTPTVSLITYQ